MDKQILLTLDDHNYRAISIEALSESAEEVTKTILDICGLSKDTFFELHSLQNSEIKLNEMNDVQWDNLVDDTGRVKIRVVLINQDHLLGSNDVLNEE